MVRGYGEILEALEPLDDCRILIAKPAKGVPTAECFARYDASGKPVRDSRYAADQEGDQRR